MSERQSKFEVDRFETEANKLGVEVNRCLYRDLVFAIENGRAKVLVKGEEIAKENTLGVWFRVAGTSSGKYIEARDLLLKMIDGDIFAINKDGYLGWNRMGKIAQHGVFLKNGIPIIPTRIFYTKDQVMKYFKTHPQDPSLEKGGFEGSLGWPVIAKHERGFQGKSVRKFDNFKELRRFVKKINEKNLGMFLWQKCLPTKWDIRVIVIGGKVIGSMKRSAVGTEFRSNFSLGGSVEKWNLSESDRILAEKVAKVCKLDYCGVDIMKDNDGDSFILEVNRQCQFKGFEQSTGINVAKEVVELILRNKVD